MGAWFRRATRERIARAHAAPIVTLLEERILLAAQPVVTIAPDGGADAQIGTSKTVNLRFDNVDDGTPGGDVGFAPYIDVALPTNGADGAGPGGTPANDGVTFQSATFLGQPVEATQVEFDANGLALHPFARNPDGTPRVVTGTPGDTLLVLRLPFGSFTADQTPADIRLTLGLSPLADVDTPLPLSAQAGFAFGRDPFDNPGVDAPVLGPASNAAINPTVVQLTKTYLGPEQETATGPSYPRAVLVTGNLAPGQTFDGLVLTDRMPDGAVITGASLLGGTGSTSIDAATGVVTASFTAITGTPQLRVDYFIGEFLRDGATPVLDPVTGAFRDMPNDAALGVDWTPLDPRDQPRPILIDPPGPENIVTAKSLAVQKSVATIGTAQPGAQLEWTLDAQVSNFFSLDEVVLRDTLGDGQRFDAGFQPRLRITEGGAVTYDGAITNYTVARSNVTGQSTIVFDVSDEMVARGLDAVLSSGADAAQAQVVFRSLIEPSFLGPRAVDQSVGQGDRLDNAIRAEAQVLGTDNPVVDTSAAGVTLPVASLAKSLYAVNGQVVAPGTVNVQTGDTVTFRITVDNPLSVTNRVSFNDFLPLPVFVVGDADANPGTPASFVLQDVQNAAPPPAGVAWYGAGDTLRASGGIAGTPSVTINAASNSLRFDFGSIDAPGTPPTRLELLLTVAVQDRPFGDGLLLTNQVTQSETSSDGGVTENNAIVQFLLGEPRLNISKGVIATDNAGAGFTAPVGPVAFTAPGSAGNRFTGTISSAALDTVPVDANLRGIDAGDLVSFAVVVENTGSGRHGAFDTLIRDTLPTGFAAPQAGLNLRVTDGTGAALAFTTVGTGIFDPAGGIRLNDPGVNDGAIDRFDADNGRNIVVVTYDLRSIDAVAVPNAQLTNTASIANYAANEAGTNRVPFTPPADVVNTASVTTAQPSLLKEVVETSAEHTGSGQGDPNLVDLAIGETVTYRVTLTLPEGRTQNLVLTDALPTGAGILGLVSSRVVSTGGNLGGAGLASPSITLTDTNNDGINDRLAYGFGTVTNAFDNQVTAADRIVLELVADARNLPANAAGDRLVNTATVTATDAGPEGGSFSRSATAAIEIVEPQLTLNKSASPQQVDGGDTARYTIALRNNTATFGTSAFDLSVTDLLDGFAPNAALVVGSVVASGTLAVPSIVTGNGAGNGTVRVDLARLDQGETLTVRFDVRFIDQLPVGTRFDNTATDSASSLPGQAPGERVTSREADASVLGIAVENLKRIIATSNPDTGSSRFDPNNPDVTIGEVITYEFVGTVPEGSSFPLRLFDTLPDSATGQLNFLPGTVRIVSVGASLSGPGLANPAIAFTDLNSNGNPERLTIDFGNVFNAPDGTVNAADRIVVQVQAVVPDVAANQQGRVLTNTAFGQAGSSVGPNSTASVDVVLPVLSLNKTSAPVGSGPNDAGRAFDYSIVIRHAAGSQAPAYELALADLVPGNMAIVPGTVTASAGSVSSSGNGITLSLAGYQLNDAALVVRYRAVFLDSVVPGGAQTNTATLNYDTTPGPGGRPFTVSDTETRTPVLAPAITKVLAASSIPETGAGQFDPSRPDATVGEVLTYRVTARLGEGTQRLEINDTLGAGLEFLSASVESIGGNIGGSSLGLGAGPTSQSGQTLRFDFGTVVNAGDSVIDARDTVTVLVNARVADLGSNAQGAVVPNSATVRTFAPGGGTPGLGTATATHNIDIVLPVLAVDKSTPATIVDGADVATYTIVVRHAAGSQSAAFGVTLSDLLAPGLVLVPGSATATAGLLSEAGGRLGLTVPAAYLLTDAPITVTYRATVAQDVVNGQAINNTASLAWSSAPTGGRPGAASDPAGITVGLLNSVDKALFSTSLAQTTGTDVTIGEEVTWRVTATLAEGAQRLVLTDLLPTGVSYVSSAVVSLGGITGAALAVGAAGSVSGQSVAFDFGDVINPGDNQVTAADRLVISVTGRVTDGAQGSALVNTGTLDAATPANPYGVPPGVPQPPISDADTVRVRLPDLVVDKATPFTTGDAGAEATYTVTVRHDAGSAADAWNVRLSDLLPTGLRFIAGSAASTAGSVAEAGNGFTVAISQLALGATATITYRAALADSVVSGAVITNTANLAYDTAPVNGRPIAEADTAQVRAAIANSLDKSIFATSNPDSSGREVLVGEEVTYRISATLGEGSQRITLTDALPTGLDYLSSSVVSLGNVSGSALGVGASGSFAGGVVSFALGDIVNPGDNVTNAGDIVVLEVRARVNDSTPQGEQARNTATFTAATPANPFGLPPGTVTQTLDDTEAVVVLKPVLLIDKSVPIESGNAGTIATYTVVVRHDASSAAPAYLLAVTDPLLADLILVPGSATTTRGTITEGSNSITLGLDRLRLGESVTITYQARLADTVTNAQVLENTASLNYTTNPTNGPTRTASDTATVNVALFNQLEKEITATSLPQTPGTLVAPGETITWRVTATLDQGTQDLTLTEDTLPAGTVYLSSRVVSLGGISGSALAVDEAGVFDAATNTVRFGFGTLVNPADGINDADDTIVIEVTARVDANAPGNVDGAVLANVARLTSQQQATPIVAQSEATVVVPVLDIVKDTAFTTGDAGDIATYTVRIAHTAASTSAAFNLVLGDLLAPGLVLVAGSASSSAGTLTEGANGIALNLGVLALGDAVTITYSARLADNVVQGQSITNTATLGYSTAPTDGRPANDSDPATIGVVLPPATLDKTVAETSLPETLGTSVALGEAVTWRMTATLAEGGQRLVLTDPIPAGMEYVSSRVVSLGNVTGSALAVGAAGTVAGGIVTFDFGDVVNPGDNISNAGDTIVVEVVGRVRDLPGNVDGTAFDNTAALNVRTPDNPFGVPPGVPTQPDATDDARVTLRLPELAIDKATPFASGDAGAVATYTVTLRHTDASAAPAFVVRIADLLAPGLTLVAGSATASSGTVTENAGALGFALDRLDLGQSVTITYQARLADDVVQGQSITNTASLNYSTAPENGRPLADSDPATITVALPPATLAKTLVETTLPGTSGSNLAIGEEAVFRLTATLAEGAQRLVLTDLLPGALLPISSRVVSLGNVTGSALGVGAAGSISGQTVTFAFGDVINRGDNISDAGDIIVVEVRARLLDVPGAVTGAPFTNTASLQPSTPDNPFGVPPGVPTQPPATAEETVTAALPVLLVDKSTPFTTGDAGDVATYTVVLRHDGASAADAYNLSLTDPLAAGIVLVPGSATATAGTVSEAAGAITLTLAQLARGDTVTITYQARLLDSVEQGQAITNIAALAYSTAPTDGRPLAAQDDASINVLLGNALTKTLFETSNLDTPGDQVARGETVTWRLTATLAEGTQRLLLIDDLPVGYTLLDSRVVSLGGTSGSALAEQAPGTAAGQRVSFDLGVVTNPAGSAAQPIVVELRARLDESAPDNPAPNTARLTASTPGGDNTTTNDAENDPVVVQPLLELAKADAGGFVRPGERVNYTLTVTHAAASTGPGYDLVVADALAASPWLRLVLGSVTTSAGSVIAGNGPGDAQVSVSIPRLLLGETVTIAFAADVLAAAPPAELLPNTATLGYDSNPGPGGRPGTDEDGATVPANPTLSKQLATSDIVASTDPTDLTQLDPALRDLQPGEQVTYRILVTLPPGANEALVLRDDLGAGALNLISSRVVAIGDGLTGSALAVGAAGTLAGGSVVFDFGTVTGATSGARQIEVEVVGRVRADAATGAAALTQGATLDYSIRGEAGEEAASVASDVLRPALAIAKATSTPGPVDGNDPVAYTLTVTNTSGAPAFDVVVGDDFLLGGLRAGGSVSITVDGAPAPGASIISGGTVDDPTVRISVPRLDPGSVAVVAFGAITSPNTLNGATVDNRGDVTFTSAPGSNPDEFSGSGQSNIVSIPTLRPTLDKAVFLVAAPGVGSGQFDPALPDAPIGATITYRLTVNLQEGDTTLVLRDALPSGFAFIDGQVLAYGAKLSGGVAIGTPGSFAGGTVTFDLGTVTSLADNLPQTPEDAITVEVRARALPGLAPGAQATNTATLTAIVPGAELQVGPATATVEIVEPALVITKTAGAQFAVLGQQVPYTVTLAHAPGSTAPAYDLVLTDPGLAGLLVVVPGSVVVTGAAGAVVSAGNGGFAVTIAALQLNEAVTVTYLVTIQGTQGDGTLPNTARFVADSAPGTPIGGDPANPGGSQVVIGGEATASITAIAGQPPIGPPISASFNDPGADAQRLARFFRAPGIEPAFAGAADPGSALTIALRDANGSTVNSITRMVDGGGSWVALFSASRGYPGDLPRVSEYLSGTQLFRDVGDTLIPDFSDRDIRLQDDLNQQPFTASINVTSSGAGPFSALPQNTRLYFADTANPGLYANDSLSVARAVGGAAGGAVAGGVAAAASPLSFAYNRFAGEFLGGGAAPHGGYR